MTLSALLSNIKDFPLAFQMAGDEGVKGFSRIREASELAGKTISVFLNKITSFIKSPMGIMTVATVGVYGIVKLFDALTLSLVEAQDALDNAKKEYDESKEKLNSLKEQLNEVKSRIDELQSKGTLTIVEENELEKLKTITKELQIQLEIQKELEKNKRKKLSDRAIDSIYAETNGFTRAEHIQQFSEAYHRLNEENNRILSGNESDERKNVQISHNKEQQNKLKNQALELSNALLEESKNLDITDDNAKKLYNEIQNLGEVTLGWAGDIDSPLSDKLKEADDQINATVATLGSLKTASNGISTLSSAFKELSENGYITIDTISSIQEKTQLTGDEWDEYEHKLLTAQRGTSEFNQVLSDLTYKIIEQTNATEEEITAVLRENGILNAAEVAHDAVTIAKVNQAIASYDGTQASYDSAAALISESLSADQAETAMAKLEIAKILVNSAQIQTSSDIDNLIALANAAGASVQSLRDFERAKVELADGFVGPLSPTTVAIKNNSYTVQYDKLNPNDFKVSAPKYSGGSSGKGSGSNSKSSSADKDSPKWEDPTDARIADLKLEADRLSKKAEEIHDKLDIADRESDFARSIGLTNELISVRKDRIQELGNAMNGYMQEAQYIRDTNPYDESAWFNEFGEETQAYIDYLNSLSAAAEQSRVKEVFSQLQRYKKAYIEAEEKLLDEQKSIVDDEKKLIEYETSLYEDQVNDIKHQISVRESLGTTNDPLDISDYEKIMSLAETRANELRAKGYDDNSEEIQKLQTEWLDAYKAIKEIRVNDSDEYIEDRNLFGWENGDSEVKAIKRKIDWYKQYYPNALKEIRELERDLETAKRNEKEKFISDLQEACNRELEIEQNKVDKLKEINDFEMSINSSKLKLLESLHNIQTSIMDEQHNIDKELMASKTMSEYLDEDTRKLLFNDDDYKALSERLKSISKQASDLQAEYNNKIQKTDEHNNKIKNDMLSRTAKEVSGLQIEYNDALEVTAENIDEITNGYERQYELLMQQYEVEKAKLEVAKKQQQLNNVLNERNVSMYIAGQGWTWVANTQDVINAQNELADAEYEVSRVDDGKPGTNDEADYLKVKHNLEALSDTLRTENNELDKQMEDHRERLDNLVKLMEGEHQTVADVLNAIAVSGGEYIHEVVNNCGEALEEFYEKLTGDSLDYGYDPNIDYKAIMDTLPKGSYLWEYLNRLRNAKIDAGNLNYEKYASGTSNAKSGMGVTGEKKSEYIVSPKYGKLIPITSPALLNYEGHEKVFSNEQVERLWEMSKNFGAPMGGISDRYLPDSIGTKIVTQEDNRVIINGLELTGEKAELLSSTLKRVLAIH